MVSWLQTGHKPHDLHLSIILLCFTHFLLLCPCTAKYFFGPGDLVTSSSLRSTMAIQILRPVAVMKSVRFSNTCRYTLLHQVVCAFCFCALKPN